MAQFSIKDLENLSGIKAHTLRIWEQRYELLKPNRTDTNIRYYDDEQLKQILNVSTLNRNGYKISQIARMSSEQLRSEAIRLQQTGEPVNFLDALMRNMVEFNEDHFEQAVDTAISELGFEEAFSQVIFPFMERTGVLWAAGVVRPVQEHFVSNLIRRKIIVAIDRQVPKHNPQSKKVVLFLPEGETHELPLLFSEYLLRKANHKVYYIGNSLPYNDLAFIQQSMQVDCFVTFITVPTMGVSTADYVARLSEDFKSIRLWLGGSQLRPMDCSGYPNIQKLHQLEDLKAAIASL